MSERTQYSICYKHYESTLEFWCTNKKIMKDVRNYIKTRMKAEMYDAIESIPKQSVMIEGEEDE